MRRPRPRTLRWRLVAILAILLAATSVVIGALSILFLHNYLIGQVDQNLSVASGRAVSEQANVPPNPDNGGINRGGQPGGHAPDHTFIGAPGQSPNTVVAVIVDGAFHVSGYIDEKGTEHPIGTYAETIIKALPTDGKPHTRDLGGTLGSYRLESTAQSDGTIFVTGLPLESINDTTSRLTLVIGLVTLAGLILAAVAAAVIVQRALRPLRNVAATASSVTELTLDRGAVPPSTRVDEKDIVSGTEVGRVGTALNQLLGHVTDALRVREAADVKVRTFVADASHELRTPLATVRAYAELSRRDYADAPDGLKRNIDRIESESVRMTSLVEDLLLLARLDEEGVVAGTTGSAEHHDVDLSLIVAESVGDAHAAAPDHLWQLDMSEHPIVVVANQSQLRQIVVNLLANARVHTPPGTTVLTSLRQDQDGVARLDVTDNGPGIDPALLPVLFERFVRGDSSRARATGSTGLGLAIVQAVVDVHHGTVSVESEPGRTAFHVVLPADNSQ